MISLVDNYDSFTFNLVQQIERLASESVNVVRNDAFDPEGLIASGPTAIVISPGPGVPSRAGRIVELVRRNRMIPMLGVCLGHQAIGEAFGGRIVRAGVPVHGKTDDVQHDGARLFAGCPRPMRGARYHSLVIERTTLPSELTIDAWSSDGLVMAVSHRERPVFGVQFHPESYGTEEGDALILNFLKMRS